MPMPTFFCRLSFGRGRDYSADPRRMAAPRAAKGTQILLVVQQAQPKLSTSGASCSAPTRRPQSGAVGLRWTSPDIMHDPGKISVL